MKYTKLFALSTMAAGLAFAHCDNLDGPVVQAARKALASGDVNLVLPWVQPDREAEIRDAFTRTASVRKLNADAAKLADTWFFETVVRVHRQGEGAAYDGLKPAGAGLTPAIEAADRAVQTGDLRDLEKHMASAVRDGLRGRFQQVLDAKAHKPADVIRGRAYVAAYVDFIHFAERLRQATANSAEHEH